MRYQKINSRKWKARPKPRAQAERMMARVEIVSRPETRKAKEKASARPPRIMEVDFLHRPHQPIQTDSPNVLGARTCLLLRLLRLNRPQFRSFRMFATFFKTRRATC